MRVMITSFSIRREFVGNGSMWAAQSAVSEPRLKFLACKALLAHPRGSSRRAVPIAGSRLWPKHIFFAL